MKVQFASIEAALCAYAVLMFIALSSSMLASYRAQQYSALNQLHVAFAEHDFIAEEQSNFSLNECLKSYLFNQSPCILAYERAYAGTYDLVKFDISGPANRSVNESCFSVFNTSTVCLGD